jgi:hypothetical protein
MLIRGMESHWDEVVGEAKKNTMTPTVKQREQNVDIAIDQK